MAMAIESLKCPNKVGNDSIEGYIPLLKLLKYVDEENNVHILPVHERHLFTIGKGKKTKQRLH
eukprot:scaffold7729_cov88-Skeletonema_dohrnii-CCMP3373.AAC.4